MNLRQQLARAWKIFAADGFFLGNGVAFGTLLSIVPLMVVALLVARTVFNTDAERDRLVDDALTVVGPQVARGIEKLIARGEKLSTSGVSASMIALLIFAGSRVFRAVQHALNILWGVQPKSDKRPLHWTLVNLVWRQLPAFLLVPCVGVLALVLFAANAVLSLATTSLGEHTVLLRLSTLALGLLAFAVLFALVYKALPAAEVSLSDAMFGGAATALLVSVGTLVVGFYLSRLMNAGVFGLSTTFVAVLLWILYSSQTFLFGAALTRARAEREKPLEPKKTVAETLS